MSFIETVTATALSLDRYQQLALRTAKQLDHQAALEHAAMGLVSDAGEVVSAVKAAEVYRKPLGSLADPQSLRCHLREECGDVLWFSAYAADLLLVRLSEVATRFVNVRPRDLTDSTVHRALRVATSAAHCAQHLAFPEYAHQEYALNSLALTLDYLELTMDCYGLHVQDVMQANLAKLRLRYPVKYTDEAAQARADKPHVFQGTLTQPCTLCGGTVSATIHDLPQGA